MDFTQRSDVEKNKNCQWLRYIYIYIYIYICCSMESSVSRVTPRVFTTLENGMNASPTERQSTGILSLLDDGPQRSQFYFFAH